MYYRQGKLKRRPMKLIVRWFRFRSNDAKQSLHNQNGSMYNAFRDRIRRWMHAHSRNVATIFVSHVPRAFGLQCVAFAFAQILKNDTEQKLKINIRDRETWTGSQRLRGEVRELPKSVTSVNAQTHELVFVAIVSC